MRDSLIVCEFAAWGYGSMEPELLIRFVNAVPGHDYSADEMQWVGERTHNACRLLDVQRRILTVR